MKILAFKCRTLHEYIRYINIENLYPTKILLVLLWFYLFLYAYFALSCWQDKFILMNFNVDSNIQSILVVLQTFTIINVTLSYPDEYIPK